jgi:hypothetical protein
MNASWVNADQVNTCQSIDAASAYWVLQGWLSLPQYLLMQADNNLEQSTVNRL